MKRGQLSIEFFLILAIVMVMASTLLTNALEQMKKIRELDNAALAKSALDSVTGAANYAKLGGPGTKLTRDVFIPKDVICFLKKPGENSLFCNADAGKVVGETLVAPSDISITDQKCYSQNWLTVVIENKGGAVEITCSP